MLELPHILAEYEEINSLLHAPISSSSRIKYLCFTASQNYIALGSTIGSVYLFKRKSCKFFKLLPLSEGAVLCTSISPNEKTIAIATNRGIVCLIQFKVAAKVIATSREHLGNRVTCLCWNNNNSELFVGDNIGRVSVMVLSIFSVNGMFQTPSCILMNLDSSIVQLCFNSPLLLISTLTRCFISDTINEQYKQIGNKVRNGEFGACFFNYNDNLNEHKEHTKQINEASTLKKGLFNLIQESNTRLIEEEHCKRIFCARPSSRIWEVSVNGTVIKTHQFREALAIPPSPVFRAREYKWFGKDQTLLTFHDFVEQTNKIFPTQSINLSYLDVIAERYIFSWTSFGLYIIDPISASIVLWNNEFSNISMACLVGNSIYLMTNDIRFHCITFISINDIIIQLYKDKHYKDCLDICIKFINQIQKIIDDNNIDYLTNQSIEKPWKRKVCEKMIEIYHQEKKARCVEGSTIFKSDMKDDEIKQLLQPLIFLLNSEIVGQLMKLESGIVLVNPVSFTRESSNGTNEIPERKCLDSSQCKLDLNEGTEKLVEETESIENEVLLEEIHNNEIQEETQKLCSLINCITPDITEDELQLIILDIRTNINSLENLFSLNNHASEIMSSLQHHYFETLLSNSSAEKIMENTNDLVNEELCRVFVEINVSNIPKCLCGFPEPINDTIKIKFLELGNALLSRNITCSKMCLYICKNIPYMWQEYLPYYIHAKLPINHILQECIQTIDSRILSILLPKLGKKKWKSAIKFLYVALDKKCLFCLKSTKDENEGEFFYDWTNILQQIFKKYGVEETFSFLERLESSLGNVMFDKSIFKSLIYTKILNRYGVKSTAIDFSRSNTSIAEHIALCSKEVHKKLVETMGKDLCRAININEFPKGPHNWGTIFQDKSQVCSYCTLSLDTPVLLGTNGIAIFPCSHAYHINCLMEKKLFRCLHHT
ncbi:uncharacterized protein pink [Prorops nasuta]|uniref:uncharacterized protein pink n=1 Tax=Prorops nasuta TaxID=863751 RepID=UPI0034CF032F